MSALVYRVVVIGSIRIRRATMNSTLYELIERHTDGTIDVFSGDENFRVTRYHCVRRSSLFALRPIGLIPVQQCTNGTWENRSNVRLGIPMCAAVSITTYTSSRSDLLFVTCQWSGDWSSHCRAVLYPASRLPTDNVMTIGGWDGTKPLFRGAFESYKTHTS
jgi:hypothetical protein